MNMYRFPVRSRFIQIGSLLCIALIGVFVGTVAQADKADVVIVKNPVTIANPVTTVKIDSSTPLSVSVSPGTPFQTHYHGYTNPSTAGLVPIQNSFVVPANKRLVLQFVSATMSNGATGSLNITTSTNGPQVDLAIENPVAFGVSTNQAVQLFADPNSTVSVVAFFFPRSDGALNVVDITLSGYLQDAN